MSIPVVRHCLWCGHEHITRRQGALCLCKQACYAGFHRARVKMEPSPSGPAFARMLVEAIEKGEHPNKKYSYQNETPEN